MSRTHHFAILLAFLAVSVPAHAYIDPASGSFLLQLIIGGVTGAFVTMKLFWGRFRNRAKKVSSEPRE